MHHHEAEPPRYFDFLLEAIRDPTLREISRLWPRVTHLARERFGGLEFDGTGTDPMTTWLRATYSENGKEVMNLPLTDVLARLQQEAAVSKPPPPDDPPVIISLGARCYRVGGSPPVYVTEREENILQAFLAQPCYDKPGLARAAALDGETAVGILRAFLGSSNRPAKYNGMFAPAIHMPGARGKGSYHVNIKTG
jgi:hypothetical protein